MSVTKRSRPRRLRAALLAELALCALLGSAHAAEGSVPIDNGDFENGFTGWQVEPTEIAVGAANAFASATIKDGTFPGSKHPVTLMLFADASGASGPSSSQAGIRLRHPGIVAGRFLDFRTGGGWGIGTFGGALLKHRAEVVVRGTGPAAGRVAAFFVGGNESNTGAPCSSGFFADFGILPMGRSLDLAPHGFQAGDPVEIEFYWEAVVVAEDPCQQAEIIGTLFFDDFAFRN